MTEFLGLWKVLERGKALSSLKMVPPLVRGCAHTDTEYLYIHSIPQTELQQNSRFDCYKIPKAWIFDQKPLTVTEHPRFRPRLVLRVLRRGLRSGEATPRAAPQESRRQSTCSHSIPVVRVPVTRAILTHRGLVQPQERPRSLICSSTRFPAGLHKERVPAEPGGQRHVLLLPKARLRDGEAER